MAPRGAKPIKTIWALAIMMVVLGIAGLIVDGGGGVVRFGGLAAAVVLGVLVWNAYENNSSES